MYLQDIPVIDDISKKYLKPVEVYKFWDYYFPGFSLPYRDLRASDMTLVISSRLRESSAMLTTLKRKRVLHKITGWSRIDFLNQAFPDAKFIHIIRDGRAVSNSFLNVNFWNGWQGPDKWIYGSIPDNYRKIWEESSESFVILAAITWMMLMDSAEEAIDNIGRDRLITIKYEDLCNNLHSNMNKVLEFCELKESDKFNKKLSKYHLKNSNNKYKKDLTPKQIEDMEKIMKTHLERYGYL